MNLPIKQYKTIGPNDILPDGTEVSIRGKYGKIISHEVVDAEPCGKIVVHTAILTHKRIPTSGYQTEMVLMEKAIKWSGSYSAIFANIM